MMYIITLIVILFMAKMKKKEGGDTFRRQQKTVYLLQLEKQLHKIFQVIGMTLATAIMLIGLQKMQKLL